MNKKPAQKSSMRLGAFFIEILPLGGFFIGFEWGGIFTAAIASSAIGVTLIALFWLGEGRLALFSCYAVIQAALFTMLALVLDSAVFIKIQPTLFNGGFALVLLGGFIGGVPMMKRFFEAQFDLTDDTWMRLSCRWGVFFLLLALANEAAWRNLDDQNWVWIKTFVFAPASGTFMLAQLPLTLRGRRNKKPNQDQDA